MLMVLCLCGCYASYSLARICRSIHRVYRGFRGLTGLSVFKERITKKIGDAYWVLLELYLFLSITSLLSLLRFSGWLNGLSEEYLASMHGFLSWTMLFVVAVSAVYLLARQNRDTEL